MEVAFKKSAFKITIWRNQTKLDLFESYVSEKTKIFSIIHHFYQLTQNYIFVAKKKKKNQSTIIPDQ